LFPDIAPPTVQVTASYPGANAEVVARAVATPIEEAINGVENMTYMTSTSSNDGSMAINVFFKVGTNPDLAAVNVQSRVSRAVSQVAPLVDKQFTHVGSALIGVAEANGLFAVVLIKGKQLRP
jgi:HAE1 family hydrophobic/amphiphilic exporter-1